MRIGLLTDAYWPGINGIIRFISLHKKTLERMGHEVFVFTWGKPHPRDEPGVIRSRGIPFIRPGYHIALGYDRRARDVLQTLDVLHANQPLLSGYLALRYGHRYSLPVVVTAHSRYDLVGKARLPFLPLPLYRAVLRRYLRWFGDRCDLMTVASPEADEVMRSLGMAGRVARAPLGIDVVQYRTRQTWLTRDHLRVPDSASLALCLGRLDPEKNVGLLLEALAQPELEKAYLLLVGDGPERERLEEAASELGLDGRVRFVGEVPPDRVPAYASLADVFVTASWIEMFPVAVLEALAAGLPIVGLDVPWIQHTVQHDVNGLLCQAEPEPFARAWARLAGDGALRARLADSARATGDLYDIQRTTSMMVSLYEQVIEAHRQGGRPGRPMRDHAAGEDDA